LLEVSASGGTIDILPVLVVETVAWGEAAKLQPAEPSKTISNVILNAKNQLHLFMSIWQHLV
jgi:hypothetical protein